MKEATEPVRALSHLQSVEEPGSETTPEHVSAIDKLTNSAVEKRIASLERRIATQQGYISDAEQEIETLVAEQKELERAMRDRWAARLGEPNEHS